MKREFYFDFIGPKVEEQSEIESELTYSGLCINCDNREECELRNNEFVIWHCEEYE